MDGFHARCVRCIIGVKHSYWSRISNRDVLSRVHAIPLSNLLLEQQLNYFGKVFRLPNEDIRRQLIFENNSYILRRVNTRSRGRPRAQWNHEVLNHALLAAGGLDILKTVIQDKDNWKQMVRKYCRFND